MRCVGSGVPCCDDGCAANPTMYSSARVWSWTQIACMGYDFRSSVQHVHIVCRYACILSSLSTSSPVPISSKGSA